jgi:hypothetical protein
MLCMIMMLMLMLCSKYDYTVTVSLRLLPRQKQHGLCDFPVMTGGFLKYSKSKIDK